MAIGDSAGILFRIKADSSDADKEFAKLRKDFRETEKAIKASGSAMENAFLGMAQGAGITGQQAAILKADLLQMGNVAEITGKFILGMVGATAIAATALAALTVKASEYGSAIFDAKEKTGLSAATLTTLKVAADNSGSSLEQVTTGAARFAKTLGEAEAGNKKAQATLEALGVTTYDLDTALGQATKTIFEAKEGTDQITLSQKAFGARMGAELLPVIKQFGGDLEAATKEAERLGTTLTEKDILASDQFGDALGVLSAQAKAAAVAFTSDLMPVLTHYFTMASEWYAENKEIVRQWGAELAQGAMTVGNAFEGLGSLMGSVMNGLNVVLGNNARQWNAWSVVARAAIAAVTLGASELNRYLNPEGKKGKEAGVFGSDLPAGGPRLSGGGGGGRGGGGGGGGGRQDDTARRNLQAQLQQEQNNLKERIDDVNKALVGMLDKLRDIGTSDESVKRVRAQFVELIANLNVSLAGLEKIENQLHKNDTVEEKKLLKQQQEARREAQKDRIFEARAKFRHGIESIDAENEKEADKRLDIEIRKTQELLELEEKRQKLAVASVFGSPEDFGIDMTAGIRTDVTKGEEMLKQSGDWLKNLPLDVLDQFAQGIGNVVANLVLMGTAGPNAMKKLTASVLAGVAAQAAVLAIKHFAMGIAALTPWGAAEYGPAPAQFLAAAKFGSIAAIAGLAGRAIAGNSFNQQANVATGGGGGVGGGQNQQQNYGTQFQGFNNGSDLDRIRNGQRGSGLGGMIQALIDVTAQAEETHHRLATRIEGISTDEIVRLGAPNASRSIRDAYHAELGDDSSTTEGFYRRAGGAR